MLRRLYPDQPESFAFTPANMAWAEAQMTKYPEGRQASAVIPLLWRAQEQEGWLTRPAIEEIGRMLDMAYIRVLEVATFYFMFQLQPVGSVAHIQICGTTSCMICGAEDLVGVCRDKIAPRPHQLSDDGKFSWEEVECLGACANAPMAQIGKDYYEDLTAESLVDLIDRMAQGEVPRPGSQNGRFAAEPAGGLTSLSEDGEGEKPEHNASVALAVALNDTIKRIDGTEVPLVTPWTWSDHAKAAAVPPRVKDDLLPPSSGNDARTPGPRPSENVAADDSGVTKQESTETEKGHPEEASVAPGGPSSEHRPLPEEDAEAGSADDSGSVAPGEGRVGVDDGESPLADHADAERAEEPARRKTTGAKSDADATPSEDDKERG